MRKRFIIWSVVGCVACLLGGFLVFESQDRGNYLPRIDDSEVSNWLGSSAANSETTTDVIIPIDIRCPLRVAIGSLGFSNDEKNRSAQDLLLTKLTGAPGLELVDRQSLDKVLGELNLSLSGLVRAEDAVRAGKLLKADWFVLGTGVKIAGTNSIVLRIVDAHTGILYDSGVFADGGSMEKICSDMASFVRASRQTAAAPKPRMFLAVGTFENLGANRRQEAFPSQLRAFLTAAYHESGVTLLEREAADVLLQEERLDLAGLTDGSETNTLCHMQSAYWFVDGAFQSYETTNFQVELVLNITRMFGRRQQISFRGIPDKILFAHVKEAIDLQMKNNAGLPWRTRNNEVRAQMTSGKELSHLNPLDAFVMGDYYNELQAPDVAVRRYNSKEAIRAFQVALMLEPTNREAKAYLAACLAKPIISRVAEARDYYQEIIDAPIQDNWTRMAKWGLDSTFSWSSPQEEINWFEAAVKNTANPAALAYYRGEIETAQKQVALSDPRSTGNEVLEKELLYRMTNLDTRTVFSDLGVGDFMDSFGTNRSAAARRMAELYPTLKSNAPSASLLVMAAVLITQVDTNAAVVSDFQELLDRYAHHPDPTNTPPAVWSRIWWDVNDWTFEHKLYRMAATLTEDRMRILALNPSPGWDLDDEQKISLAYAYMGLKEWRKAMEIFESFSNTPIEMGSRGPWGKAFSVLFPSKEVAYCRQKLGLPASPNSLEFDIGRPVLNLRGPSTLLANENGLWIGTCGNLLHLGFNLETNLTVRLPINPNTSITTLAQCDSSIWIGTQGAGLIQYDQTSRKCRSFGVSDGLAMNQILTARMVGNRLWIGYPRGIGFLDLSSHKFTSFTSSIVDDRRLSSNAGQNGSPPGGPVESIAPGPDGEIWFSVAYWVGRYRPSDNSWERISQIDNANHVDSCSNQLLAGQSRDLAGNKGAGPLGLTILNFRSGQCRSLPEIEGLPGYSVSAMAEDGNDLWVGGYGYVASFDLRDEKIRKFAYVQSNAMDRIQIGIGGGYVWALFGSWLYRVALSRF